MTDPVRTSAPVVPFSLVRWGPFYRLQRVLHLFPAHGFGVGRRILFAVIVTWVPIVVWAVFQDPAASGESLLQHFGVHARLLLGIPLFILAEAVADPVVARVMEQLLITGLVADSARQRFEARRQRAERLLDSWIVWVAAAAVVVGVTLAGLRNGVGVDAVSWATTRPEGGLGFGGVWYVAIGLSFYYMAMLTWLWRLVVMTLLCRWIAGLDLRLVPAHPDRAGGLGFIEELPRVFAPVVLALSSVTAAHFGHQIVAHGAHVAAFKLQAVTLVVILLLLFSAPLLAMAPGLRSTRRRAIYEYGALASRFGELLHRRWILGEKIGAEPILQAPEIGPMADLGSMYETATHMRTVPLGKQTLLALAVPAVLPLLLVALLEIPLRDILKQLAGALL